MVTRVTPLSDGYVLVVLYTRGNRRTRGSLPGTYVDHQLFTSDLTFTQTGLILCGLDLCVDSLLR